MKTITPADLYRAFDDSSIAPALYPRAAMIFRSLCSPCRDDELESLHEKLVDTAEWLTLYLNQGRGPDTQLGCKLCEKSVLLIGMYPTFDDAQKALAVGALRYFLFRNDVLSDQAESEGYEDDRLILNFVLQKLGLGTHIIEPSE